MANVLQCFCLKDQEGCLLSTISSTVANVLQATGVLLGETGDGSAVLRFSESMGAHGIDS